MELLIASLTAFLIAPFAYLLLKRLGRISRMIETLIFIVVTAMVIVQILPESYQMAGWYAFPAAIIGWLIPTFLEKFLHQPPSTAHGVPFALAIVGLSIHALFDGIALSMGSIDKTSVTLSGAIVLHRFPVALFLWWILRPAYGFAIPISIFALICMLTVIGYYYGLQMQALFVHAPAIGVFQAVVAGSLLHLASHTRH